LRGTRCLFLVALILIPIFVPFAVILPEAKASSGEADVYILELSSVPAEADGVAINQTQVQMGAINACLPNGPTINLNLPAVHPEANGYNPYYQATAEVVTTWTEYEQIVLSSVGKIIVNTHGDYLPVPSDYNKRAWVDTIAEAMATRRLSWVHCGGYTFYEVYDENGTNEGNWTETVNGAVLGAGFDQLMSHIGIQNANITTPPGAGIGGGTAAEVGIDTTQEPATDWAGLGGGISEYVENPLREDQFLNRVNSTFFHPWPGKDGQIYMPGGVVSFAETNVRNASAQGAGVYVHLGVGGESSSDYWNGYIGTAAALLPECWTFGGQTDAKQVNYGVSIFNATIGVEPVITRVQHDNTDISFDMVFGIYGATQNDQVQFSGWWFAWAQGSHSYEPSFWLDLPDNNWSDVWTQADAIQSGGSGGGGLGILPPLIDGTMWFVSLPGLLTGPIGGIASGILWGIGGLQLLAQWAMQGADYTQGVNQPDHGCYFNFWPGETDTVNNGVDYYEFETFVGVHVTIPRAHSPARTGWMTFPLHYNISACPNWHDAGPTLSVADTLQIAVYFGNGGQSDAGSGRDTGHSYNDPNVVNVMPNTNFHGYLEGYPPDNEDWYSFSFSDSNKKEIYFDMTPPSYVDFNLQLYNSDGSPNGLVASSNNPAGQAEHVETYSNLTGPWYVRIYPGSDPDSISHSGVYSCSLSSLKGDINLDGTVDIYDAIKLEGAFNSNSGDPRFSPCADINGDGTVDIYDAIILAANFGKSYQAGKGMSSQKLLAGTMTQGGASVLVNPSQLTVFKGEVFAVNVKVTGVTDLQGWEFKLYWNSTVLNCTNVVVQTPSEWQNNTQNYGSGLEPTYNATHARYWQAQAAAYPASSFNGSMTIATLTFQALQPGTTSLTLADVKLGNSTAEPIACSVSSGSVNVYYGRYMRSDTQTVNGLNAYVLNIPESTSSASFTQSGSGHGASWGIRAWVRHSNGVEQEISLDGQTGTPKAVVGRSSGSGIESGTVSVAQTALQQTDSLVIRVYVQVGGSGWTLCATFTTEQLQATTLQATTGTVYYYTYASYLRPYNWTTSTFYWGTTTYNSQIQNLQYT